MEDRTEPRTRRPSSTGPGPELLLRPPPTPAPTTRQRTRRLVPPPERPRLVVRDPTRRVHDGVVTFGPTVRPSLVTPVEPRGTTRPVPSLFRSSTVGSTGASCLPRSAVRSGRDCVPLVEVSSRPVRAPYVSRGPHPVYPVTGLGHGPESHGPRGGTGQRPGVVSHWCGSGRCS